MKENNLNKLTHHGVKGMKWGRRKRQPNVLTTAFKTDIDDIRGQISNFKKRYSNVVSDVKNSKKNNISRIKAYKDSMHKSDVREGRQRIVTLKNRVDKYGYKTSTIINTSKHAASAIGSLAVAKSLIEIGGRTISDNWTDPYISKGRKVAAVVLVGGIASIPISSAIRDVKTGANEAKIQRDYHLNKNILRNR